MPSRRSKKPGKVQQKRAASSHLLVLECEQDKRSSQRLDFGSRTVFALRALYPSKRIALVPTSGYGDHGPSLVQVLTQHGRFRSILIVGHSNTEGIQLTSDQFCTWSATGLWIAKFEPKKLFLAACHAGRSQTVRYLFDAVPSLQEIYASPVDLYVEQSCPLVALVALALEGKRIDSDASSVLRALNFVITAGQIFRWRRNEIGQGQELTNKVWDVVASICDRRR